MPIMHILKMRNPITVLESWCVSRNLLPLYGIFLGHLHVYSNAYYVNTKSNKKFKGVFKTNLKSSHFVFYFQRDISLIHFGCYKSHKNIYKSFVDVVSHQCYMLNVNTAIKWNKYEILMFCFDIIRLWCCIAISLLE